MVKFKLPKVGKKGGKKDYVKAGDTVSFDRNIAHTNARAVAVLNIGTKILTIALIVAVVVLLLYSIVLFIFSCIGMNSTVRWARDYDQKQTKPPRVNWGKIYVAFQAVLMCIYAFYIVVLCSLGLATALLAKKSYKLAKADDQTELAKAQVYGFFQALLSLIIAVCYVPLVIVEIIFTSYLAGANIVLPGLIAANVISGVFLGIMFVTYAVFAIYRYVKIMYAKRHQMVIPT